MFRIISIMVINEIAIREQIGAELSENVMNQYDIAVAMSFPSMPDSNFQNICEEIRGTW